MITLTISKTEAFILQMAKKKTLMLLLLPLDITGTMQRSLMLIKVVSKI